MSDYRTETKEKFRKKMAEYFYLIGDDETYQDILTESEERLILDAYNFGILHFENCIKEHKGDQY